MLETLEETEVDLAEIDVIVEEIGHGTEAVIPILQAIQTKYRYLPSAAMERVCELTEITPATVEGVATFYTQFRHSPVGEHVISLCDGTACHVKGSLDIHEALSDHMGIEGDGDTDPDGRYTIRTVACLGCCSLAPAVKMVHVTYPNVTVDTVSSVVQDFEKRESEKGKEDGRPARKIVENGAEIRIGLDSCCVAGGSDKVEVALHRALEELDSDVPVKHVSCVHMCHQIPVIEIIELNKPPAMYAKVDPANVADIVARHFKPKNPIKWLRSEALRWSDHLYGEDGQDVLERHDDKVREDHVSSFLTHQDHIATEFRGEIDPASLDEYLRKGGYMAVEKLLFGKSTGLALMSKHRGGLPDANGSTKNGWPAERIIQEISESGLRGRGGAGFPTGTKWQFVNEAPGAQKYVICNGDEGDPGAFMDRMILESYSYRVLEGMLISALAVGADQGYLYIRAEYPLATKRIRQSILDCEEAGLLGDNILGSGKSLHLKVVEGAGAFVCGEETALIASVEGKRGMPTIRPPYPAIEGLYGCPTLINNTETLSMVPWIIRNGAEAFAAKGTEKSKGTKVFSLSGKVRHGGLIEVPMGITINDIVQKIGGGVTEDRAFKAILVGGPSGGIIPASLGETPVDYEALSEIGAMMGSGGMVVLDDSDCVVEMCRYFLSFTQEESCGKCSPCRIGTKRMLEMLTRLCEGKGKEADIELLDELGQVIKSQSLCGLGKTAPNPVLTALTYFKDEFIAHVNGKCPAGKCKPLIDYWIVDTCIGCTMCAQVCPADCIETAPYTKHVIDLDACARCDACLPVCPTDAILAGSR
ncbi:MAG: NAD(P)H-dependent oxidoreductase subunit E [Candidatus Hydrogenedentes bacterium]|jgi:NADH-quinone oxidoreductase subunit F|nr:NAD(P)H-dependent oxidoreductase subunit E [Candidatus Hydrogenedentota bacterium]